MIRSFKVAVPPEIIEDLQNRLAKTSWPEAIDDSGWSYGTNIELMKRLCDHWRHRFDWREWESKINAYPQFIAEIDDMKIHFLHLKASKPNSIPLLLTHGWPSSVLEYLKIIPLLSSSFD